jgi:hypothetical protein
MKTKYLDIKQSDYNIETFEFGDNIGESCLITAGVHGTEETSVLAAIEVIKQLEQLTIKGKVVVVPICNPSGFFSYAKQVVPEDGKNLNRVFPANKEGSFSERLAFTLTEQLVGPSDYHIDLHGADVHEVVMPFVFYAGRGEDRMIEQSRVMASALEVDVMVQSSSVSGFYNNSGVLGKPSILIERGGSGIKDINSVNAYVKDVLSVLHILGFIDVKKEKTDNSPTDIQHTYYPLAETRGIWKSKKKPGQHFAKGEILGEIYDVQMNYVQKIYAEVDGVILYQLKALGIEKGSETVAYGKIN